MITRRTMLTGSATAALAAPAATARPPADAEAEYKRTEAELRALAQWAHSRHISTC